MFSAYTQTQHSCLPRATYTHTHTMAALHTALVVMVHHCYFSTADGQNIWAPFPTSNSWFLNCSQYYKTFPVLLFSPYSSPKTPIQIYWIIFSEFHNWNQVNLQVRMTPQKHPPMNNKIKTQERLLWGNSPSPRIADDCQPRQSWTHNKHHHISHITTTTSWLISPIVNYRWGTHRCTCVQTPAIIHTHYKHTLTHISTCTHQSFQVNIFLCIYREIQV